MSSAGQWTDQPQFLIAKSLWRERYSNVWSFFCPLCRTSRRLPHRPRPGVRHYLQVALTSAVLMLASWSWFGWKGVIWVIPIGTLFEIGYRLKMRATLACQNCGFDPYLYLIDSNRARVEVESYWRKKFDEKGIPYPEKRSSPSKKRSLTGSVS